MKRLALLFLPIASVAVLCASAAADEPATLPERQAFASQNGRFRLEIVRFFGKSSAVKKPTATGFSEAREYFGAEAKTRASVETDKAGHVLKVRLATEPFASRSVHQMRLFETAVGEVFEELAAAVRTDAFQARLRGPVAHSGFRRLVS